MKHNTRAIAAQVLTHVVQNEQPFHTEIITTFSSRLSEQDAGFIAHLCFGTLRFYDQLQRIAKSKLRQGLKPEDQDIFNLILVGLFQLFCSDTPSYATVNETVSGCLSLKKPWAKNLVNAILRSAMRDNVAIQKTLDDIAYSHPSWLTQGIKKAWPDQWETILEANQKHAPMVLRVNLKQISRDDYLESLKQVDLEAEALPFGPAAIVLTAPASVQRLPGFETGQVSVQDLSPQLACDLLQIQPNMRVLDACAAPGGKSAHILEQHPTTTLFALDNEPHRYQRLVATLERLQLNATSLCQDVCNLDSWWDGVLFDRILLDAPCSGTGVIRRHPDIKRHRNPIDLKLLVEKQTMMLEKLWPLLKPNGILVYATCSVMPVENVQRIEDFMQRHTDAREIKIDAPWGVAQHIGRQILPGTETMDGFYYAVLTKQG